MESEGEEYLNTGDDEEDEKVGQGNIAPVRDLRGDRAKLWAKIDRDEC